MTRAFVIRAHQSSCSSLSFPPLDKNTPRTLINTGTVLKLSEVRLMLCSGQRKYWHPRSMSVFKVTGFEIRIQESSPVTWKSSHCGVGAVHEEKYILAQ